MAPHILVIDDDPAVTSVLRRGLYYEGYSVATANSGMDGLAQAREQAPDLVMLDRMMPGLDGLEVLRRLRAADAQLPILFLTAKDAPTDQVEGLTAGADDYIVKPFLFDVLCAHVQALLRRQQLDHPGVAIITGRGNQRGDMHSEDEHAWLTADDSRQRQTA